MAQTSSSSEILGLQESEAYDKVAKVIGKYMDEAWQKIMSDIVNGNVSAVTAGGRSGEQPAVTRDDLEIFSRLVSGANLNIDFLCRSVKGAGSFHNAHQLSRSRSGRESVPEEELQAVGTSGSKTGSVDVSIGVGIKF